MINNKRKLKFQEWMTRNATKKSSTQNLIYFSKSHFNSFFINIYKINKYK